MQPTCECGCGTPVRYAKTGTLAGQPRRFALGHNVQLKTETKWYRRRAAGYEHRLRAERALGRSLPKGADVHHADGTIQAGGTLVICDSRAYHMLLHARMRVLKAGGNPNTDSVCKRCHKVKGQESFRRDNRSWNGRAYICRDCVKTKRG